MIKVDCIKYVAQVLALKLWVKGGHLKAETKKTNTV